MSWGARCNAWLLIKLTPKGVVFSVLVFSTYDEMCGPGGGCRVQTIGSLYPLCAARIHVLVSQPISRILELCSITVAKTQSAAQVVITAWYKTRKEKKQLRLLASNQ